MKKADRDEITRIIGVEPIMINSALVSAQNRKRLYWTNIPGVQQPEDRGILLKDILEDIPFDFNTQEKAGSSIWKPLDEKFLTDKIKLQLREKAYAITATYT
jgi:DNA (cytosine-5)-methyltransferase 3A